MGVLAVHGSDIIDRSFSFRAVECMVYQQVHLDKLEILIKDLGRCLQIEDTRVNINETVLHLLVCERLNTLFPPRPILDVRL